MLTHASLLTNTADTTVQFMRLLSSPDNSTTLGLLETGTEIFGDTGLLGNTQPGSQYQLHRYPNFRENQPNRYIKVILRNSSAGTIVYTWAVEISRIPG